MRRRHLIALLGAGLVAGNLGARAQPVRRVARIGVMTTAGKTEGMLGAEPRNTSVRALLEGLREVGYVLDRDFVIVPRGGESNPSGFAGLAAELVAMKLDLIIAPGPMLEALKQAKPTCPIIMAGALDPIEEGLIHSLSRPGGLFTGLSSQSVETVPKRLELLREIAPGDGPVAILWDKQNARVSKAAEVAAQASNWQAVSFELREAGDLAALFKAIVEARARAVLVTAAAFLFGRAHRVAELTLEHRLPAMYPQRVFTEAGGLISYAANLNDIWRRAAHFADKILKGEKPADLPVEQPTKFELVINLRTAKALGLTLPASILIRATEVIE